MSNQEQCIDFPDVKTAYKMITINYEIESCLEIYFLKRGSSRDPVCYLRMVGKIEIKIKKEKRGVNQNIKNKTEAMEYFRFF